MSELRRGLRSLCRTPGFFLLASFTLALGIGIATLMFSVTESVLWRPLPFPDSERLVLLSQHNSRTKPIGSPVAFADFLDWRERAASFQAIAAISYDGVDHTLTGAAERARSLAVSAGFFEILGVRPTLGRTFRRDEENARSRIAILTDAFWRTHYAGSADAIGQTIELDRQPYLIAGVLPAGFHLDSFSGLSDPQLFVPLDFTAASSHRDDRALGVIARTRRGVSLAAASAEMDSLARHIAGEHPPEEAGWDVRVENLRESFTKYNRTTLYLYLGFGIFVLLIACANVAGLELVRAVGRQREYALRVALGARRRELLSQAIAETAWIALPGGVGGALAAVWAMEWIRAAAPAGSLARGTLLSVDLWALALVVAVSAAIAFVVGMAPAIVVHRLNPDAALRGGSKSVTASPGTGRVLKFLIASEMTLSFVLLFGAGLFLDSHSRLRQVELGFDPRGVLTVPVTAGGGPATAPARLAFFRELAQRAAAIGGLRQVALASTVPLAGSNSVPYSASGNPPDGEPATSLVRVVSPEFFEVLGLRLLGGRTFTQLDSESAPRVAVLNENLARAAFPGRNPVGQVLTILPGWDASIPAGPVEIVGLVANTHEIGVNEVPFEDIYLPFAQNSRRTMSLVARAAAPVATVTAELREELRRLDPDSAVYNIRTLDEILARQWDGDRFNLLLVTLFAGLAALLGAVGIYGAIAFSVAQRTREFGLRMALGAAPAAIRRLALGHTSRLTLLAVAFGAGICLLLGKLLEGALYLVPHQHEGILYGVSIRDPRILAAAALIVLTSAALASLAPASRAAAVEPSRALRQD